MIRHQKEEKVRLKYDIGEIIIRYSELNFGGTYNYIGELLDARGHTPNAIMISFMSDDIQENEEKEGKSNE